MKAHRAAVVLWRLTRFHQLLPETKEAGQSPLPQKIESIRTKYLDSYIIFFLHIQMGTPEDVPFADLKGRQSPRRNLPYAALDLFGAHLPVSANIVFAAIDPGIRGHDPVRSDPILARDPRVGLHGTRLVIVIPLRTLLVPTGLHGARALEEIGLTADDLLASLHLTVSRVQVVPDALDLLPTRGHGTGLVRVIPTGALLDPAGLHSTVAIEEVGLASIGDLAGLA